VQAAWNGPNPMGPRRTVAPAEMQFRRAFRTNASYSACPASDRFRPMKIRRSIASLGMCMLPSVEGDCPLCDSEPQTTPRLSRI